ncbi:MAG TPA: hypothetical protein VL635_08230 [Trinickia sp.]|nr:hypothetical protein [Trinickia sp.]
MASLISNGYRRQAERAKPAAVQHAPARAAQSARAACFARGDDWPL